MAQGRQISALRDRRCKAYLHQPLPAQRRAFHPCQTSPSEAPSPEAHPRPTSPANPGTLETVRQPPSHSLPPRPRLANPASWPSAHRRPSRLPPQAHAAGPRGTSSDANAHPPSRGPAPRGTPHSPRSPGRTAASPGPDCSYSSIYHCSSRTAGTRRTRHTRGLYAACRGSSMCAYSTRRTRTSTWPCSWSIGDRNCSICSDFYSRIYRSTPGG